MHKSTSIFLQSLKPRGYSTSATEKLVASVLFERLPVVIPKIDPVVYAFQEFSLRWRQQYRRRYPDEVLGKSDARGKGDYQIDFEPAPRMTEADKTNDRKLIRPAKVAYEYYNQVEKLMCSNKNQNDKVKANLFNKDHQDVYMELDEGANQLYPNLGVWCFHERALDRRLYLLLKGNAIGTPSDKLVWHFPEKVYESEETMRKCAESALESVIGDLSHTYFVGNAPMAHMAIQPTGESPTIPPFKRFFFKSQVIGTSRLKIGKCDDHVWVTKDELLEYFPEHATFLNQMIIS